MTQTIVIAEMNNNAVHPSTAELVSAAMTMGGAPTIVVPCTDAGQAGGAANMGGANIIAAKSDAFAHYDASAWAAALDAVVPQGTVLTGASPQSKDMAARLAARRSLSVVQDAVQINGNQITSPVYSGKAMQTVAVNGPAVVSVRSNVFAPAQGGATDVSVLDTTGDVATSVQEFMARASERLDVSEANIIISGGRGMGSPDNFSQLEAIADTIGAAVGASRAAVDTWDAIPHSMQVGQTGKTVNPNLYIAVGISGAIQHLAGMRSSKYIVAINKDADAPIFQHADYGIVATWEEALPVLHTSLKGMMG
ncbi:MAG: electron transfer flavoprotein subunit alpha/FixB family protein [Candidatus Poseidonia sp.]|jgi:electron transfer flavoprotein alpha subunit|nr:electron transfer flavoprotein subunit alpha/FixB family protein [Poseidonia sp.]MEC8708346.1 electron transfer flavoprotein subunit alpha/FixB family protein [Candidatus Thermoplasmatota archaeon]|tara:strand:- start:1301 stop:2227 length:927 start_codon:yes stop_codon:yes gene_type:complete